MVLGAILVFGAPGAIWGEDVASKASEGTPGFSFLTWGRALLATDQHAQAASYLEKEVERRPDSAEGHMLLGKAYWGMGRIKDARAAWEKAGTLESSYVPVVKARLSRLDRLQNLVIISNEANAEDRVPPFFAREILSGYFASMGFTLSQKLSGEFLATLTSTLENLAPPAMEEIRKMSGADILILSEVSSYLEYQDFRQNQMKVTARIGAKAIDLQRHAPLASCQTLRIAEAPTLLEASERALRAAAERIARDILQQIAIKEALKPSLVVGPADILLSRVTYPQGSKVPIEVTIHNEGDEEAKNFEVAVKEASSRGGSRTIGSILVALLPPLSSVSFEVQWNAQLAGKQQIAVTIYPDRKTEGQEGDDSQRHRARREVLVLSQRQILGGLYRLAFSHSLASSLDRSLLQAQWKVLLNPTDQAGVQSLLAAAVDRERGDVTVIGLGLRPWNIFSDEVALPMAKRAARVDAQNWLALIRKALGKEPLQTSVPTKDQVYGASILLEQPLPDGSCLVKMRAPLS